MISSTMRSWIPCDTVRATLSSSSGIGFSQPPCDRQYWTTEPCRRPRSSSEPGTSIFQLCQAPPSSPSSRAQVSRSAAWQCSPRRSPSLPSVPLNCTSLVRATINSDGWMYRFDFIEGGTQLPRLCDWAMFFVDKYVFAWSVPWATDAHASSSIEQIWKQVHSTTQTWSVREEGDNVGCITHRDTRDSQNSCSTFEVRTNDTMVRI